MAYESNCAALEEAFDRIEEAILPSLSALLDTLLETASLARAGTDAETHAGELRALALRLESVTRQVEALTGALAPEDAYRAAGPARISA